MALETGQVTPIRTDYGSLSCVRLNVESDSAGVAVKEFLSGVVDGELRHVCVWHEDDGSAATLSVYLEDDLDNSLLAGDSVTGLAAGSGGSIAKYRKLQYQEIGSVQARELLVCGPQTFRFVRSSAVVTRLVVEFWFIASSK